MGSIARAAAAIAAILVREGIDYVQSKSVFNTTREGAGLGAGAAELFELRWGDGELGTEGNRGRLFVRRTLTWAHIDGGEG